MANLLFVEGLAPSDGEKNFEAIRNAVTRAVKESFDGISFPAGEFDVYNEKSITLEKDLLAGRINPVDWKYMKSQKNRLIELSGVRNFTIAGNGVKLNFKGLIAPIDVRNSKNIKIENLAIDWIKPLWFTADVVSKTGNEIEIVPAPGENIVGGEPVVSIQNIDLKTGKQGGMSLFSDISNIKYENGKYTFTCAEPEQVCVGESLILRYIYQYSSGIHFYRCEDISLSGVTLNAAVGMGIIGHKVKNINLSMLTVKPRKGRVMSTNTDATHFINCSGLIDFKDCYFEGMGDDATNVHGFYLRISDIKDGKMYLTQEQECQDSEPSLPDVGQTLEFVDCKTLLPYGEGVVETFEYDEKTGIRTLTFKDGAIANAKVGDVVANSTEIARLNFENCTVKNIRGRGALIQTRGAKVHGCDFEGCTGEGIHICTETGWWESISTRDIEISNNRFVNCGFGSTMYCDAVCAVTSTNAPVQMAGVHQNIKIVDNYIEGNNIPALITCAKGVEFCANTVVGCGGIEVRNSEDVVEKDNIYR